MSNREEISGGHFDMDIEVTLKFFSFTKKISISKQWLRFGIIAAAILLSTVASYFGTMKLLLLLLLLVGGVFSLLFLMENINLGFIFIFLAGMFIPFEGPGRINASILAVILLVFLWIIDMFVVKRNIQLIKSRVTRPALWFLLLSIIAFGIGQIPWFVFANQAPLTAQIGGFAIHFFSVMTMIMTADMLKEIRWLKAIVWAFVGLGTFYILGRAFNLTFIVHLYQPGFTAGSMLWTWLVAIPLSQAIFNNKLKLSHRILLYSIVVMTFYIALAQGYDWKSGWVPPAIAVAVLVGLRFRKLLLFAIPFAGIIAVYLAKDLISTDQYSWGTRLDAWIIILSISRISPIFGLGFANYYWYTRLIPIRGYNVEFNSHSQYIDLMAQMGILGLICFFWIFFELGNLSWSLVKQLPDGFERAYAYCILAGLAGTLVSAYLGDWVLPFTYNIGLDGFRASILPWIFFGGMLSVEQIHLATKDL